MSGFISVLYIFDELPWFYFNSSYNCVVIIKFVMTKLTGNDYCQDILYTRS